MKQGRKRHLALLLCGGVMEDGHCFSADCEILVVSGLRTFEPQVSWLVLIFNQKIHCSTQRCFILKLYEILREKSICLLNSEVSNSFHIFTRQHLLLLGSKVTSIYATLTP